MYICTLCIQKYPSKCLFQIDIQTPKAGKLSVCTSNPTHLCSSFERFYKDQKKLIWRLTTRDFSSIKREN